MGVTYSQALLDRATAYVAKSVSERRYDGGLSEIAQLLSDITGEPAGGCRQCQYSDYFARVRAYITQATRFLHPEPVSKTTPNLRPEYANETFVHESYSRAVLGSEMTAEDAVFFRQHFPHAFAKEADADKAEPKGEGGKPLTEKQQLQARYTELFGVEPDEKVTIAELKKHNAAKEADAGYHVPAE